MEFTRRQVLAGGTHRGPLNLRTAFSYSNPESPISRFLQVRHTLPRSPAPLTNASRMCDVRGALLLASVADHRQIRYRQVTILGGVLTHAVLFCLGLSVFLHAVHFGIGDHAGNRNRMTNMIAELEGVALDLPSPTFRRSN